TAAKKAKIGVSSAEISKDIRDYIFENDLTSALFYVQPGIKISPLTGCTEKEHLFFIEKVRRECVLYSEVIFLQELSESENKLLNDSVKAVRRLGGKRRRGAGECKLSWCDDFKNEEISTGDSLKYKNSSDSPLILKIRLTNLQPLVIASKTVGNAIQSSTEIPGHMLLSYYVNNVFEKLGKERIQKAVMNNEISVSNFLPEFDDDIALPVPLCMAEKKGSKELINRLISEPSGDEQVKDIRTGYVRILPSEIKYFSSSVRKVMRTHNTVEDSSQRPNEITGGLFTYEAIEAGQKFIGYLKIENSLLNDILKSDEKENIFSKLSGDFHKIGRSRKDEYGKILLELISQESPKTESLKLIDGRTEKSNGKYLVVYLKSDLLLRDSYNSYSTKIEDIKNALSKKLGVELDDIPENEWIEREKYDISPLGGTCGHCFRAGRRDSWQTVWTLPRPSLIYFREGSIFMFKVADPENWSEENANSLIQNGLGERISEGYGQILFNPDFICNPEMNLTRPESQNLDTARNKVQDFINKNSEAANFVNLLKKDVLRKRFRQVARCEAYTIIRENNNQHFAKYPAVSCSKNKRPSASQFGALREAVSAGHKVFKNWVNVINKESSQQNAWNQYWREML
ncbi:MAG: hypothetical protein IJ597_03965, partial [Synergistaceae bacterium]|nr:hypothetical protein [Synergistaceae bacterium]